MERYTRIETDNPLLDEIIYGCKHMMIDCVLKDEKRADLYETVESLRDANTYISIIENRCKFEYMTYDFNDYLLAGVLPEFIPEYLKNASIVPKEVRDKILPIKIEQFMNEYEEPNNYYRMLLGLPDVEDEDIDFIRLTDDHIMILEVSSMYKKIPIHLLPTEIKTGIVERRIIDELIQRYPNKRYLRYLTKNINLYNARTASKFELIYLNQGDIDIILYNKFKETLAKNRIYIMKTMDFKAYDFYSDYYDRFIMMMILVQTISDMINEIPEYYISRELFDIRTIEYFFNANGVDFFPEIPLKYQQALVKNLNKLIKFKASTLNIVDISSIFGFSNVEIFNYYLCKTRNIDSGGNYVDLEDEEPYDLRFLKVPMGDMYDESAKKTSNYMSYESVISGDKYWNGPYDQSYIKKKILEKEFNIIKSKYISIDTVYSLTEASFELSYFINMVMFSTIDKSKLRLYVPIIDSYKDVDFVNLFIFIYALMYEYIGVTDDIIYTGSGYLKFKGFNFKANMAKLGTYVNEHGYTLKDLGVDKFQIPTNSILSYNQLVSIFINNKKIYDHIIYEMEHTGDIEIYKIYKHIYDSLMLTDLNFDIYYLKETGAPAKTYTEYLKYKEPSLYNKLEMMREEKDEEVKRLNIYNMITNISNQITSLLNSRELQHIFINLPTESGEYLKDYMFKIINFFKSYKLSIHDIQTVYKLDKENKVYIFDDVDISKFLVHDIEIPMNEIYELIVKLKYNEIYKVYDKYRLTSTHNISEKNKVYEIIYNILADMKYTENIPQNDKINGILSSINSSSRVNMYDEKFRYSYIYYLDLLYNTPDLVSLLSNFYKKDTISINEILDIYRKYHRFYEEDYIIYDKLNIGINLYKTDKYIIEDNIFINPYQS